MNAQPLWAGRESRASSAVALARSPAVLAKIATPDPIPSPREVFRVGNPVALKRSFPGLWAEYLRQNFTSPGQVQRAFPGIDEKTCRDWWSGKRNPTGCFVAAVVARDPAAMSILGRTA